MMKKLLCNGFLSASIALLTPAAFAAAPDPVIPGRTLEDFFTSALESNPELSIARENWNVGSARRQQINGQLLPQVNVNANLSDNTRESVGVPEVGYDGERYTLQLSQVLFNWSAFAARSQAYLNEDQAEAEYYAQVAQLLTEVADKYLLALQAEDDQESITAELEATSNQVERVQMLYDLENARITDLYEAQARQAAVQAQSVMADANLTLAREALRAISGLEVGEDLARLPEEIVVEPTEGTLDDWITRARENNQILEARNFAFQSAQKRVSEQRGAYMPRVSLVYQRQQANVGYDNQPLGSPFDLERIETEYVGIDFSMPIFAGGSNRARVREAYSIRNIAESELRQAELDVIERTRTAYLQAQTGEARIEAGRVLAESTATSHEAMERGFELGTVTTVDVLDALRNRFSAERDLQKARYDHIRARLLLRREAGVLTAEDMRAISDQLSAR